MTLRAVGQDAALAFRRPGRPGPRPRCATRPPCLAGRAGEPARRCRRRGDREDSFVAFGLL